MSTPYINVTEFIENESQLESFGGFLYDTNMYAILNPLSSIYGIEFFGNPNSFNANSIFAISNIIQVPDAGIRKSVLLDDTLVILDNDSNLTFYHISTNARGEFNDISYIESTFPSDIRNGKFNDVVVDKNTNNNGAIFIKDNQEVIFYNVNVPSNIDALINNRLTVSAALNKDRHFTLVFDTGEILYYNGNNLSDSSYNLIPQDIIDNEDYSNFNATNKVSPNTISKATSVSAYNGFAITTFDGNVIVWGDEFQDLNNDTGNMVKPISTFDATSIAGIGNGYGVYYREDGNIGVWGIDNENRLGQLSNITDINTAICFPEIIMYTTGNGKNGNIAGNPNSEPSLSGLGTYYDLSDIEDILYPSSVSYNENGYVFIITSHDNPNQDRVKLDFKLKKYNGEYFIPVLDFMDYEPANFELEIYTKEKCNVESIGENIQFSIVDTYYNEEGIADYSKVVVTPIDKDQNGVPDNPLSYNQIINENSIVLLETFIDLNGLEATRVSKNTKFISESLYIEPNIIYYADIDKTIMDYEGNNIDYIKGEFYKGNDGSPIPNNATLISNGFDGETGIQYYSKRGKSFTNDDPFKFQWTHYSSDGTDRIDPSISSIMDMYVLTNAYDNAVRRWLRNGAVLDQYPKPPTSEEIRNNIRFIERNKSTSDQVIYIPAEYKLLFGSSARPEHQAEFKIIKMNGATLTDNEIKSRTIDAINEYFNIDNWDFGEAFYYTELAAHIHNKLSGHVASVVIVPKFGNSTFGDLFQIKCEPNELFLSTASVSDIVITSQYTNQNLKKFR